MEAKKTITWVREDCTQYAVGPCVKVMSRDKFIPAPHLSRKVYPRVAIRVPVGQAGVEPCLGRGGRRGGGVKRPGEERGDGQG